MGQREKSGLLVSVRCSERAKSASLDTKGLIGRESKGAFSAHELIKVKGEEKNGVTLIPQFFLEPIWIRAKSQCLSGGRGQEKEKRNRSRSSQSGDGIGIRKMSLLATRLTRNRKESGRKGIVDAPEKKKGGRGVRIRQPLM